MVRAKEKKQDYVVYVHPEATRCAAKRMERKGRILLDDIGYLTEQYKDNLIVIDDDESPCEVSPRMPEVRKVKKVIVIGAFRGLCVANQCAALINKNYSVDIDEDCIVSGSGSFTTLILRETVEKYPEYRGMFQSLGHFV
ncbi:hypothetical protein KKD37_04240 [Patescibacteria group bacterium]|nr:hypothetical protein [Patescibacteria group bacterium]